METVNSLSHQFSRQVITYTHNMYIFFAYTYIFFLQLINRIVIIIERLIP